MSRPLKKLRNPLLLSVFGIVALVALAISITKFAISDKNEDVKAGAKSTAPIAKSSGHPSGSSGNSAPGGPRKSKGKPGEEIQGNGE